MLQFAIVDKIAALESLAPEWDALLAASNCDRAFSSATWFQASVASEPVEALHVLSARRQGNLCALLPLVIRDGRAAFPGKLADYQDLIAPPQDEEASLKLLSFALAREQPPVSFSFCREDGNLVRALRRLRPEWSFDSAETTGCCHIHLDGDFDGYLATRSYMFRQHLRRALRKAERDGLQVREMTPAELDPKQLADLFLKLHFESMGEASCFHRAHHETFARTALAPLYRQGRLRAMGLFREGRQVGIDLYTVGKSYLGNWNAGYLAETARWSPGKLMLRHAILTAFEDGLERIDLLRGLQPWKLGWATGQHRYGNFSPPEGSFEP